MPCERRALLLSVAITTAAANAAHAERPPAAPSAPVSAELLEFLGSFETSGGKAVDPLWFLDDGKPAKADSRTAPAARTPGAATPAETKP